VTYIHEFPHARVVVHYHPTSEQFTLEDVDLALDQRVHALELDLHFRPQDRQIVCNHDRPTTISPTLDQVVSRLLDQMGSSATLHADGRQFFLVLEPKHFSTDLFDGVLEHLERYAPHLSTAVRRGDAPRGITVIITGEYRRHFHAHFAATRINRLCIVEDHDYSQEILNLAAGHPPFQWVALKSGGERGRVNDLHTGQDTQLRGRYNVRVWDCRPRDLGQCLASGVDQINCDRAYMETLKQLIRDHAPHGRFPTLAIQGSRALLAWRGRSSHDLYLALGTSQGSGLNFPRQIALTRLLPDECLVLTPRGALTADGRLLILYESLSDHSDLRRLWHRVLQRLPWRWARRLRAPQSLRYVSGRFASLHRFVTFEGRERLLAIPSRGVLRGRDPAVAATPDGRILLVYEAERGRGLRYVSETLNPDGELACADYPLLGEEVCVGYTPAVAVDPQGRVLVVYRGGQDEELMYVSGRLAPSGRIVGRRFSLAGGEASRGYRPSVALDDSGRVIVAYQRAHAQEIWYVCGTLDRSGQFNGTPYPLTPDQARRGSHPAVAFDPGGDVILLYERPADHGFHYLCGPLRAGRFIGSIQPLRIGMDRL
jgi:hypothetical protein